MRTLPGTWKYVLVVMIAAVGLYWVQAQEPDPSTQPWAQLRVVQDEESVEKTIARYLREKDGLQADYRFSGDDEEDLTLKYTFDLEGTPEIPLLIDTMITGRSPEGDVTERCIKLFAFYVMPDEAKNDETLAKVLALNNQWMQEKWVPGRIYVDTDGDVCLETFVNIPGAEFTVHTELVRDAALRMAGAWQEYYGRLQGILAE